MQVLIILRFELHPGRRIDVPFDDRRDEEILTVGEIDERAEGRAIVLIGHVDAIEQRLVGVERARGVDRGAIVRERAELLLNGVIGRVQRLLGGDIDDAARFGEPVENRRPDL